MAIESYNRTPGIFEYFYSKVYSGNYDWQKVCFTTGVIKRPNNNTSNFYLSMYSLDKLSTPGGIIYVDDVSVKK